MKRLIYILAAIGVAIASFLTGFFIRQPQMNKLKKQVETLQRDNRRLVALCQKHKQQFQELLIQQKALKAFQFRKKATPTHPVPSLLWKNIASLIRLCYTNENNTFRLCRMRKGVPHMKLVAKLLSLILMLTGITLAIVLFLDKTLLKERKYVPVDED